MILGGDGSRTIMGDRALISFVPETTVASTRTWLLLEIQHESKHTIAESVGEDNTQSKGSLSCTVVVYLKF